MLLIKLLHFLWQSSEQHINHNSAFVQHKLIVRINFVVLLTKLVKLKEKMMTTCQIEIVSYQ